VDGQQWTDGDQRYSDNGSFYGRYGSESDNDLVAFVGLLPDSSQRAPVSRPAETESTTAVAGGVSEDPGRIIYNLEQRLEAAKNRNRQAQEQLAQRHQTINDQTAEIDRLRTELQQTQAWRTAATDAHSQSETLRIEQQTEIERLKADNEQLRSANEYIATLERLLDDARDNLRDLEAAARAFDHHCEGMKAAYLAVIKTFVEARS
jgi:exonuclease VII large subunit